MPLAKSVQQYCIITANYWLFTMTDGALRMLVVLHFYTLGYSSLQIAFLFIFYEAFGIVTNLIGGWLGARLGLNRIMQAGLLLQSVALIMLLVPESFLTITWVMVAQAVSGIAKDLNKMSAKSAIKHLVPAEGRLFKWVSALTGSKNALKGLGFFLGAALLGLIEFRGTVVVLLCMILIALLISVLLVRDIGQSVKKPRFSQILSRSSAINRLSGARFFLFAARDAWFVVALPVYFSSSLGWTHWQTGGFMALWIIGYGIVQALAPHITSLAGSGPPDGKSAASWALVLAIITITLTTGVGLQLPVNINLIPGLLLFGVIFAVNSSIHSYLVVSYADFDSVSVDVGFYYMANAAGRLMGTLLSGGLYLYGGLLACLAMSSVLLLLTFTLSVFLPRKI